MIALNNRVRGFYKLEKFKATNGREVPGSRNTLAEFENLITDQGLNALGADSPNKLCSYCFVGSGSVTPSHSDSDLGNFVAKNSSTESTDKTAQSNSLPWYLSMKKVYRFNQGEAAGNLSEVGIGWSQSGPTGALFSRALIKDADGNPSSIAVLSDEYLDVTYELRIYPDLQDFSGVVNIGGEDYNYLARAAEANSPSLDAWEFNRPGNSGAYARAYAGGIGGVSDNPSGSDDQGASVAQVYNSNSLKASAQYSWGLNDGNIGGVRSIAGCLGWTRWQVQFSRVSDGAAIPKDNTKVLTLTLTHSWARG